MVNLEEKEIYHKLSFMSEKIIDIFKSSPNYLKEIFKKQFETKYNCAKGFCV